MNPKRCWDMSLLDGEVEVRVGEHVWQHYDPDGPGYDRSQVLLARAKRLLPLWRKWGLEQLQLTSQSLETEHVADDEELRECTCCEYTQYQVPEGGAR